MSTRILVQHHSRQWYALPAFAVHTARLLVRHQPGFLQALPDPGVAAGTAIASIPAMKVVHIPANMLAAVSLRQRHHFVDRGTPIRDLLKSLINQPLEAICGETRYVASKATLAHAQNLCRLGLGEPSFFPSFVCLFEPHLA